MKINVSEGMSNYSQRKTTFVHIQQGKYGTNKINWTNTCNVNSLVMGALYSGWVFPKSDYEREPDGLADFIVTKCLHPSNWYKEKMPALWHNWIEGDPDAYSPLELHEVLAHYFNEYIGCTNADKFTTSASIRDIFGKLYDHIAVPTSVKWGGLKGHIICLVGFEADCEPDVFESWLRGDKHDCPVTKVIFDDPWGKYEEATDKYAIASSGNDCEISFDTFISCVKDVNNQSFKYAHLLAKPATLV